MKEQLFEILHNRKRMPGERFSDIEGKIENLVNQEVEKRIAERMPSEAEKRAKARHLFVDGLNVLFACEEYDKWLRSRLTPQVTPQVTPQEQKEGGEG